jgi:hypothetical protein
MGLRKVDLAEPVVIADITTKEMVKVEVEEVDGVEMVYCTFLEPDSRGFLHPKRDGGTPLSETQESGSLAAWLNHLSTA